MINYNKEADLSNIKTYNEFGISESAEPRHKCVICGVTTCIDSSYSCRGHKLICSRCFNSKFKNPEEAFNWIQN